jgi:hypothetical protein
VSQEPRGGEPLPADIATRGTLGERDITLGITGRDVWFAGPSGTVHAVLEGPDLTIGTRFLPVVDWDLAGFQEPPVVLALVAEGLDQACLFDGRSPLTLLDAAGAAATPDANTFAATLGLRYLRTCPGMDDECALYGDPAKVAAAVDPAEPPGGFFVRTQDLAGAPDDLDWETTVLSARAAAAGPATVARLVTSGSVGGWKVEVERATAGEGSQTWVRLFLKKGRNRVHAFDLDLTGTDVRLDARLHGEGNILVLWVPRPELGFTVSVHNKRDGAVQGGAWSVGLSPYYDLGTEGIEGVALYPVLGRTPPGIAMWDPSLTDAVFYAAVDAEPAWMAVAQPEGFDPAADTLRHFTEQDGKLVPAAAGRDR